MNTVPKQFTHNIEITSIDIPTMRDLSDEDYREYVSKHGLMYVDHHEVLRSSVADYPLATSREQFDILIDELSKLRSRMEPRN